MFDDEGLQAATATNAAFVHERLRSEILSLDERIDVRGQGMILGRRPRADRSQRRACRSCQPPNVADGLIVERVGRNDTVLKILPPLTIPRELLDDGLQILAGSVKIALDMLEA